MKAKDRSISEKQMHESARDYAQVAENKTDPFAYSRAVSHYVNGIARREPKTMRLPYGKSSRL